MKAAVHTRYGPPEVVQVLDRPKPSPKPDEVLIKVHASTVNRTDAGLRSAEYVISRLFTGLFRPKCQTLGCEFAGQIEAVGAQVTRFQAGDRVFGFNDHRFGGHGEYMVLHQNDALAHIPAGLPYETAAAICEGAHYALCDIRAAKVQAGQHILVNGATGAIGSAAVQLLKYYHTTVTAVCATPYLDLVSGLGADTVIDYTRQDFTQVQQSFDWVFDAVGKSSFGKCRRILKPTGCYISTEPGKNAENVFLALTTPWFSRQKVLFPLPAISQADVVFLGNLVKDGHFKPVIDRTYPLDQIVEAYRYVETGQKIGNVVLKIA